MYECGTESREPLDVEAEEEEAEESHPIDTYPEDSYPACRALPRWTNPNEHAAQQDSDIPPSSTAHSDPFVTLTCSYWAKANGVKGEGGPVQC